MSLVNERVYALQSDNEDSVFLYGRGVYVGDEIPEPSSSNAESLNSEGIPNPKIVLDDGRVVWGCECWWGPDSEFDEFVNGREIINVDIDEDREANDGE